MKQAILKAIEAQHKAETAQHEAREALKYALRHYEAYITDTFKINPIPQPEIMELVASADEALQLCVQQIQAKYKSHVYYILPFDLLRDLLCEELSSSQLQIKFGLTVGKISQGKIHPMYNSTRGLRVMKRTELS